MLIAGPSGTVLSVSPLSPLLAVSSSSSPHAAPSRTKAASTAITFRCRLIGLVPFPRKGRCRWERTDLRGHGLGLARQGRVAGPTPRRPPPHQPPLGQGEEPV